MVLLFVEPPHSLLYFFVCGVIVLARNRAYQSQLDAVAERYLRGATVKGEFALYLRPFLNDAAMRENQLSIGSILFGGFGFVAADRRLGSALSEEQALENELRKQDLQLITVREPGAYRSEGAGTVVIDGDWKAQVLDLMVRSEVILFVGGETPGAQHELSLIRENPRLSHKTVVIVPAPRKGTPDLGMAPRNAARELWTKWGIEDHRVMPKHGFAMIRAGGSVSRISWEDTDKAISSFEVSALVEQILGKVGLASINRVAGLPPFLCMSGRLEARDFRTKAEEQFPGLWKLSGAFVGERSEDRENIHLLDLVFASREAGFFASRLTEMKREKDNESGDQYAIVDADKLWLAELLCIFGYLVPKSECAPEREVKFASGQFLLTPFGKLSVSLLPIRLLLQDNVKVEKQIVKIDDDFGGIVL